MADSKGFTLVEVTVVMALIVILGGLAVVNLVGSQTQAVTSANANVLVADLRNQQTKAMMGDDGGGSAAQDYGIFFESNQYTLFIGSSYNAMSPTNFVVQLGEGVSLTANLPQTAVVFSKGTGQVAGFNAAQSSITFTNQSGVSSELTLNKFGVVDVN